MLALALFAFVACEGTGGEYVAEDNEEMEAFKSVAALEEANIVLATRRITEIWQNGNFDVIDELVAIDWVNHNAAPEDKPGIEGFRESAIGFQSAFPDTKLVIDMLLADGDKTIVRWTATGTNTGDMFGMSATGKEVNITGMSIDRWEDGKTVESWSNFDFYGMMMQLGMLGGQEGEEWTDNEGEGTDESMKENDYDSSY